VVAEVLDSDRLDLLLAESEAFRQDLVFDIA